MQKLEIINPATNDPMKDPEAAEYVDKLRQVRSGARKDARSGNPAKRAPAVKARREAGRMIVSTYLRDAGVIS